MAFRGWFDLTVQDRRGNERVYELANSSRVVDHLRSSAPRRDPVPGVPVAETPPGSLLYAPNAHTPEAPVGSGLYTPPPGALQDPPGSGLYLIDNGDSSSFCGCTFTVPYDDSWPDLRRWLQQDEAVPPYRISDAPWHDPLNPQTGEFAGVWIMSVEGLDSTPVDREVAELLGSGGYAGVHRDASRPVAFSALIVACTNAGARFGLSWLSTALRSTRVPGGGTLSFLGAHPGDTSAFPAELRRDLHGVVLTGAPVVSETSGHGGGSRHRQASVLRVEWEMTATNPHIYRPHTTAGLSLPTTTTEPIEWVHQADCEAADSCDIPVLFAEGCEPERVAVPPAPIPTCGGCVPVCEVERRVWQLMAPLATGDESAVTVRVLNDQADPLSLSMFWRRCGTGDAVCDREHPLQITGLGDGAEAVADSITGRPYVVQLDGVKHRQVGIITTPSGAPWTLAVLDTVYCWELVAEGPPGQQYTVAVELHDREA